MSDVLAALAPTELAAFYARLADAVDRNCGDLKISLAALLMRHWLENRDSTSTYVFEAPAHVWNRTPVVDVLKFHRKVFLTEERAHFTGGSKRWAGVIPRLNGRPPYPKWGMQDPLTMNYESLVEIPLRYQITGDSADRDILYALRGFQLKSTVILTAAPLPQNRVKILFQSFQAEIRDRYDWDYSEHLTVPNPDYGSQAPNAVAPTERTVVVYHSNAKRLEDAKLAAPYDLVSRPWQITDASLRAPAEVDRSLSR